MIDCGSVGILAYNIIWSRFQISRFCLLLSSLRPHFALASTIHHIRMIFWTLKFTLKKGGDQWYLKRGLFWNFWFWKGIGNKHGATRILGSETKRIILCLRDYEKSIYTLIYMLKFNIWYDRSFTTHLIFNPFKFNSLISA